MTSGGRGHSRLKPLVELAQPHGVVTFEQLKAAGYSRSAIRWAVEDQRLERLFGSIFRLPGPAPKWTQRAHAAVLLGGTDSALSHQTAGQLWGIDGCRERSPIHVTALARVVLPEDYVSHFTRRAFTPELIGGLPVTPLARTLLDLAESFDDEALEIALDSAQHRRPFLEQQLDELIGSTPRQFTPGARRILDLLDARAGLATESPLETRVRRALRASKLPPPRLQHSLFDEDGRYVVRVDFAWPRHRVALHCDGFAWHGRRRQFELDAAQRSRLAALDWVSLIVTHRSLSKGSWLTDLTRALARREPQLSLI